MQEAVDQPPLPGTAEWLLVRVWPLNRIDDEEFDRSPLGAEVEAELLLDGVPERHA